MSRNNIHFRKLLDFDTLYNLVSFLGNQLGKDNAEKIKGFGATIIFAGVSKEDASKFTVIVKYATMEGFEAFKNDKSFTQQELQLELI